MCFGLLVWKWKIIFQLDLDLLTYTFIIFYARLIKFYYILLSIIVPAFDLGRSFGKSLEMYIQNCVGILITVIQE